jgi:CubicO group peptidase (beta-lactamase class C family)
MTIKQSLALAIALALAAAVPLVLSAQHAAVASTVDSKVDGLFAKWSSSTPGCAVGVASNGTPVLAKGYGMADLEHDVSITPATIFEAGSVSKQFTAASVLLLARDGKLSLDDEVRKYIPELPEYQSEPDTTTPGPGSTSAKPQGDRVRLTIRHMLNHTSGLRDWGSVAAIAGWPRTTRVHTHAHVLELVSRQHALNFPPGTRWSYTNTGFNLAAIIVERLSGVSFQEFTRTRLFQPLGMSHTSWRDDYTRIVKNRAIAYAEHGEFHTDMPFENVYGNGGLLTTVGDLMKWNERFDASASGDAPMITEQQEPGRFNDGRRHGYALGLFVGRYKGLREVYHSGSTAGYSAFLTRFPDQRLSVAVLCNASGAPATQYAHSVAELYLGDRLQPAAATASAPTRDALDITGLYRSRVTGVPVTIAREKGVLRAGRDMLVAQSPTRFVTARNDAWELDAQGVRVTDAFGTIEAYAREAPSSPSAQELQTYAGTYESEEAETVLTAAVEGGKLVLKRRPDTTLALTPVYADVFTAPGLGTVLFRRGADRRPIELSVSQERVWDLRFKRTTP